MANTVQLKEIFQNTPSFVNGMRDNMLDKEFSFNFRIAHLYLNVDVYVNKESDTFKIVISNGSGNSRIGDLSIMIDNDFLKAICIKQQILILDISSLKLVSAGKNISIVNNTEKDVDFLLNNASIQLNQLIVNGQFRFVSLRNFRFRRLDLKCDVSDSLSLINLRGQFDSLIEIDGIIKKVLITKCRNSDDSLMGEINLRGSINYPHISDSKIKRLIITNVEDLDYLNLQLNKLYYLKLNSIQPSNSKNSKVFIHENSIERIDMENLNFSENLGMNFGYINNDVKSIKSELIKWGYKSIISINGDIKERLFSILELKRIFSQMKETRNEKLFEAYEKRYYYQNNRTFPLWITYWSNSFGLSMWRSLNLYFSLIALEILIIFLISGNCWIVYWENFGVVFSQLLSPVHKTEAFTMLIENNCQAPDNFKNILYVVDNINKILIGYAIFQFISAWRYKYNLK